MNHPSLFRAAAWCGCVGLAAFFVPSLRAGVVLDLNKVAQLGTVTEDEKAVTLQTDFGSVPYTRDKLMWYTTDKAVDTLYKAAQKAKAENNGPAAMALFRLSAAKEPATQAEAEAEYSALKQSNAGPAVDPGGAAGAAQPPHETPEEKIARGKRMIDNGNTLLKQDHIDGGGAAAAKDNGDRLVADGNRLVAEGEKELAEIKKREDEERARQAQIAENLAKAAEANAKTEYVSQWTEEEKKVNALTALGVAVVVLLYLWHIATKEAAD